jgi:hypothetical protein
MLSPIGMMDQIGGDRDSSQSQKFKQRFSNRQAEASQRDFDDGQPAFFRQEKMDRRACRQISVAGRISKSETNQIQINPQIGKIQNTNPKETCLKSCIFWSFEIVSNFGFRASKFLPVAPLRLGAKYAVSDSCSENPKSKIENSIGR